MRCLYMWCRPRHCIRCSDNSRPALTTRILSQRYTSCRDNACVVSTVWCHPDNSRRAPFYAIRLLNHEEENHTTSMKIFSSSHNKRMKKYSLNETNFAFGHVVPEKRKNTGAVMIHPAVLISFFAVSILVGILVSPLAQLVWLVIAAVSFSSAERFFAQNLKKLRVHKFHLPNFHRKLPSR